MPSARILSIPTFLGVIGINAVPAAGFLVQGWSAEATMLLYLLENVSLTLLSAARVRLARTAAPVSTFLLVGLGFTAVSATFVAFFLFAILGTPIDWRQLGLAFAGIVAFQLVTLVGAPADETLLERTLGRVFLLALGVFIGMVLAYFVERWFVVPFMAMKTIADVGAQIQLLRARFG
ncbi:MAG: DUF6498-containing protein [Thermoanaerobaculia bacterium]